jgi:hypothetical protein
LRLRNSRAPNQLVGSGLTGEGTFIRLPNKSGATLRNGYSLENSSARQRLLLRRSYHIPSDVSEHADRRPLKKYPKII